MSIYPTGSARTISGTIAGAPLIDLNGADNITIDGRIDATGSTKSLTITNISTSTTAGTSTIRFINTAENNLMRYCIVKGSELYDYSGVIFFSTSTAGNGNSGNTVNYCSVTNEGGNRPINALYSNGSIGYLNSNNTISNSEFYDFFTTWYNSAYTKSTAITFANLTSSSTISVNSFYETTTITNPMYALTIINIGSSGNNFNITGNYLGGSAVNCGGSAFTISTIYAAGITCCSINVDTAVASSIQNNKIQNFNISSGSSNLWYGFYIAAGSVNVGTITGNTIGATTGTGNITSNYTNALDATTYGISSTRSGTVNIENNTIGSITTICATSAGHGFYGI
jgi:hypothetical protein